MPTYEYECKSCGYNFDVFQNIKDDPIKTCPKCGKEVRRLINGGTGVIFKGGGFYVTDKGGSGGKSGGKTADSPKMAETKPTETKPAESSPCPACAKAVPSAERASASEGSPPASCPKAV